MICYSLILLFALYVCAYYIFMHVHTYTSCMLSLKTVASQCDYISVRMMATSLANVFSCSLQHEFWDTFP